ncbi:MAG: site-specific DNA-methyltransferase [Candidatus Hydrogenedentes bacterium]|nr:site-specific DNA-methyltransferase [Candidatus Hydrogenedentota bacterium]
MTPDWAIETGDCLEVLKGMESVTAQCCVTSPPYFRLRDYGHAGQIGLESTPAEYVERLVEVFREVWRVLKDDGILWLNLGDSYSSCGKNRTEAQATAKTGLGGGVRTQCASLVQLSKLSKGLKPKDLIGIPWRVAFALQSDGWYLRQDIIWSKPNSMPESTRDRCSRSHEYIFMLTKRPRYYYDYEAVREPMTTRRASALNWCRDSKEGEVPGANNKQHRLERKDKQAGHGRRRGVGFRNKRDVWTVSTQPYTAAHFATFPPKLIEPCVLAGSRVGDLVIDPFSGAGTTGLVSVVHGRKYLGIELNPEYVAMSEARIEAATRQGVLF